MGTSRDENLESGVSREPDFNTLTDAVERTNHKAEAEGEADSVEKIFSGKLVPTWQNQLTFRALAVSFLLGIMLAFIVMKITLTTGMVPSLNVSAGLLDFFFVKSWTAFLGKSGFLKQPFTRQENTVVQTCVVATSGIAFGGEFSYFFSLHQSTIHV